MELTAGQAAVDLRAEGADVHARVVDVGERPVLQGGNWPSR
ncbi:hypothetical protein AB0N07_20235 [Streptomyces sp. NPDC051172]